MPTIQEASTASSRPEIVEHASRLGHALKEHVRATDRLMRLLGDPYLTSMVAAQVDNDAWPWIWDICRMSRQCRHQQLKLADELDTFHEKKPQ